MSTHVSVNQAEPFRLGPGHFDHVVVWSDSVLQLVGDCSIRQLDFMGRGCIDVSECTLDGVPVEEVNALGGYVEIRPGSHYTITNEQRAQRIRALTGPFAG